MADLEQVKAELLRGYKIFPLPDSPTLRVLRLDTETEKHWVLVTKQLLLMLSDALREEAQKVSETQ
jgi:hypothetical protein